MKLFQWTNKIMKLLQNGVSVGNVVSNERNNEETRPEAITHQDTFTLSLNTQFHYDKDAQYAIAHAGIADQSIAIIKYQGNQITYRRN
jgi:hypothetical protein